MLNVYVEEIQDVDEHSNKLILKENLDEIVLELEKNIYKYSDDYKYSIRKIRNSLKQISIKESDYIILDENNFDPDFISESLNKITKIAIDCLIQEKIRLKSDISKIEDILDERLYTIFTELQKINPDTDLSEFKSFFIEALSNHKVYVENKSDFITFDEEVYNEVLENLEFFIQDYDIGEIKNRIKRYTNSRLMFNAPTVPLNESIIGSIINALKNPWVILGGVVLGIYTLAVRNIGIVSSSATLKAMEALNDLKSRYPDEMTNFAHVTNVDQLRNVTMNQLSIAKVEGADPGMFKVIDELLKIADQWDSRFRFFSLPVLLGMALVGVLLYEHVLPVNDFIRQVRLFIDLNFKISAIKKRLDGYNLISEFMIMIEEEAIDCQDTRTRSKTNQHLICNENYLNNLYGGLTYFSLRELKNEGVNILQFKDFTFLHDYNGFATASTRKIISETVEVFRILTRLHKDQMTKNVQYLGVIFITAKKGVLNNDHIKDVYTKFPRRYQ